MANHGATLSDESLIQRMKSSTTIEEWNENREYCKRFRDENWIGRYLDASKLVIEVLGKDSNPKFPVKNTEKVVEEEE